SPDLIRKEVSRRLSDLEKAPLLEYQKALKTKLDRLELESNRLLDAYQSECIELIELKKRMNEIKREKNSIIREVTRIDSGLSKRQLLELSAAVEYFAVHLRAAGDNLCFEERRKILRMLIQEIQIGKEEVIIQHIIPIKKTLDGEIAC